MNIHVLLLLEQKETEEFITSTVMLTVLDFPRGSNLLTVHLKMYLLIRTASMVNDVYVLHLDPLGWNIKYVKQNVSQKLICFIVILSLE